MKIFLAVVFMFVTKLSYSFELEYGIGFININSPSFRGAKSTSSQTLPFPYIKFKSAFLEIDRGGIKANIFEVNNLSLDLSVAGSTPADTTSVKERDGMPNLDVALEIGPALVYQLFKSSGGLLQFEMPIRSVITTDFKNAQSIGYNINPLFYYERDVGKIKTSFNLGRIYSSQGVNDYYYSIKSDFVTADRPLYQATSGISSDMFSFTSSYRLTKHHWFAVHLRHDDLSHSVVKDSPLVKTNSSTMFAVMYAYIFD